MYSYPLPYWWNTTNKLTWKKKKKTCACHWFLFRNIFYRHAVATSMFFIWTVLLISFQLNTIINETIVFSSSLKCNHWQGYSALPVILENRRLQRWNFHQFSFFFQFYEALKRSFFWNSNSAMHIELQKTPKMILFLGPFYQ